MNKNDIDLVKKYYKVNADSLALIYNDLGPRNEHIKEAFSYLNKKNPRVLELGCGNGRDAKEILKLTKNYTGVDFSSEMIEIAERINPSGKFIVADILNYTFPRNVDLMLSFASFVHFNKSKLKNIFSKAFSSLEKGGIFYIALYEGKYYKRIRRDELGERIFYYYSKEDIEKLVNDFKIIKIHSETRTKGVWLNIILQKT